MDYFEGQKSRFLEIFKVVLELFRKCLGIVFRYLYSLLPIADILLWGPADALPNEKSAGFIGTYTNHCTLCFDLIDDRIFTADLGFTKL